MVDLQAAREFVHAHGRDIDRALFDFHFGDGSRETVIEALGHYQNADGGFGHGLEPDISSPASNAFATEQALNAIRDTGIPTNHPLVTRVVEYLESSQSDDGDWPFAPEVYQSPIAPWFEHWTFPSMNPSCTIGGVLTELGLGSSRLHERVARNFARLATTDDLLGDEYYSARPYAYYLRPDVPRPGRELYLSGVVWWLLRQRASSTLPDAMHFLEYVYGPDTYVGRTCRRMSSPRHSTSWSASRATTVAGRCHTASTGAHLPPCRACYSCIASDGSPTTTSHREVAAQ